MADLQAPAETPMITLVRALARRQARLDAMPPPAANDASRTEESRKQ